jgi:tRNA(Ile)-lysidine synthase TilS/MesJ
LMNMLRGCHLTGLINMRTTHFDPHHGLTRVRPLLTRPKMEIEKQCSLLNIPYIIDPTNHDPSISLRNQIRHQFLFPLSEKAHSDNTFRESRNLIYQILENSKWNINLMITPIDSTTREVIKEGERTDDHTVSLLQQLGIYHDLSTNLITQISHVCRTPGKKISVHGWTIQGKRDAVVCLRDSNSPRL